jgi:uncharacterized lipoprotein YajG
MEAARMRVTMSSRLKPSRISALLAVLLLAGCSDDDEAAEAPIDDTPAAIEAPALAPNRLVEDPPDEVPPRSPAD